MRIRIGLLPWYLEKKKQIFRHSFRVESKWSLVDWSFRGYQSCSSPACQSLHWKNYIYESMRAFLHGFFWCIWLRDWAVYGCWRAVTWRCFGHQMPFCLRHSSCSTQETGSSVSPWAYQSCWQENSQPNILWLPPWYSQPPIVLKWQSHFSLLLEWPTRRMALLVCAICRSMSPLLWPSIAPPITNLTRI